MDDVINGPGVLRKEGRVDPRFHHDVAPDPLAYPLNDGMMSRDSLLELQRPWAGCAGVWTERYFDWARDLDGSGFCAVSRLSLTMVTLLVRGRRVHGYVVRIGFFCFRQRASDAR